MFYEEHEPPHFHAEHQGQLAKCNFDEEVIAGYIQSPTARGLIRQWARLHRRQLEANWENMKAGRALDGIGAAGVKNRHDISAICRSR